MKELVIVVCVFLVLLAIFIIVKNIRQALKGKCCEGCKTCNLKEQCSASKKDED